MKQPRTRVARLIADKSLQQQGVSQELAREVAAYLLTERRVGELDSLLRDIGADWAAAGIIEVLAYSAHPLTEVIEAEIVAQVKRLYPAAQQIRITAVPDPEVIGGVRLRLPNQQLDLSIEAKLNRFKQLTLTGKD